MTSTNQYVRVSCLLAGALSLGGLLVGGCGGEATGLDDLNEANLETSSDDLVSSPLTPLLTCMEDLGHNNFRAHFGYKNDSSRSVRVPIGTLNFFVPLPANQGQPIDFAAGNHPDVFKVNTNCKSEYTEADSGKPYNNGNAFDPGFVYQNIQQLVENNLANNLICRVSFVGTWQIDCLPSVQNKTLGR